MLGTVVVPKMGGLEGNPEVAAISLDPAQSELARYQRSTIFWHIDGAMDSVPQKGTLLTALVVADEGGDTAFANTYAAYGALSDDEKAALADVRVVHSLAATQLLMYPDPSKKLRAAWDRGADQGAPAGVDAEERAEVVAARLHCRTGGGALRRRGPGAARPPARLGDPATLRAPPPLEPG